MKKLIILLCIFFGFVTMINALSLDDNRKAKRYVKRFEKKIKEAERFAKLTTASSCRRRVDQAIKLYNKIPQEYHSLAEVKTLKSRYDAVLEKLVSFENQKKSDTQAKWNYIAMTTEFNKSVERVGGILFTLQYGKNNKPLIAIKELVELNNNLSRLDQFHKDCDGKYAVVIKKSTNYFSRMKTSEIYDLTKNRLQYRDKLVVITTEQYINNLVKKQQNNIRYLNEKHRITNYDYQNLGPGYKTYDEQIKNNLQTAYKITGKPVPQPLINKVEALKPAFNSALKKAISVNRWKKANYRYTTSAFKILAKNLGKKYGFQLVAVGMSGNNWNIVKKKYTGYPLCKTGYGLVLYKKKGESFYRQYDIKFQRDYDGRKYDSASKATLGQFFTPCRVK